MRHTCGLRAGQVHGGTISKIYMLYTDRVIGQFFLKRLASIIAVKGGHVEHCVQVFNMTTIHCND